MENHDNTTQAFAELLESQQTVRIRKGKKAKGTVCSANAEKIVVNIGFKTEGVLYASEYTTPDMFESYKEGDEIEATVKETNDGQGQVLLTMKSRDRQPRTVDPIFKDESQWQGKVFDAVVKEVVKKEDKVSGLSAVVANTRVFIPASQIATGFVQNVDEYVGKTIQVKITSVTETERGTGIIASARVVVEEQLLEKKREVMSGLEVNAKITGTVKRIESYGAFIDIGDGVQGLLPITSVSWVHVASIKDVLYVGQEIEVVVMAVNMEKLRVTLGYKELQPQPWDNVEEKYAVGSVVEGKVVKTESYGAFVELEPMVRALIPIGQVALQRIETVDSELNVGDTVRAKVIASSSQEKRITLSRREILLEENPELAAQIEQEREERMRARREQREAMDKQRKARQAQADEENARRNERRTQEKSSIPSRREFQIEENPSQVLQVNPTFNLDEIINALLEPVEPLF